MAEKRRSALLRRSGDIASRAAAVGLDAVAAAAGEAADFLDGRIDAFTATRYSAKKDGGSVAAARTEVNEDFKKLKDDCRKAREKLADYARAREVDSSPYSAALRRAARAALELFDAKKAALGKIDYTDLEHGAKRVLADGGCRAEIAAAVRYVFIDEYQDVNPLQDAIADSFASLGAEMFLVGDVKQSIYGFRRCTPECFMRKCGAAAASVGGYTHLRLNDNHRSSRAVVDFVNKVFTGLMTEDFGGEDYAANKLVCTGGGDGEARYYVIDGNDGRGECSDGVYSVVGASAADRTDAEAEFVAAKVIGFVDKIRRHNVDPKNADRRKSLSDIAVLVRSASGAFVDSLTELLGRCGIPCNVGRKSRLSDFREAKALLEIARCVDTHYDDLALFAALSSPMGGFTDGELAEIAAVGEEKARAWRLRPERDGAHGYAFWQKAEAYRDGGYPMSERLKAFYSRRDTFARYAGCHDAADTLGYITSRADYFRYVYETGGGDGGAAAVQAVINAAEARRGSLHAFISYCDATDPTLDVAPSADAVSISTIHSAKGLEYDYCIVADAAHSFNMSDVRDRVIVSDRGVAVKYPDAQKGELVPSAPWLAAGGVGAEKTAAEELRLFYVALTRAKTELVVCGKRKKRGDGYNRQTDFMGNIAAQSPDVEFAPPTDAPEPSRVDIAVETAVKNICDFDYGARKIFGDGTRGADLTDELRARLKIPLKTCVTAVAAAAEDDGDYTAAAPVFIDDGETAPHKRKGCADAAARGTAYHRAMELINFDSPNIDDVRARCDGFELVDVADILAAAAAMKKLTAGASTVARERYFIADLPRRMLGYTELGGEKTALVQGVIDLLIVYPDGTAAVVDYKTTELSRLSGAAYRTQLALYAEAAERAGGFRVTHTYLYSFGHGLLEFPRENK